MRNAWVLCLVTLLLAGADARAGHRSFDWDSLSAADWV
jgi:hypothetical protein